MEKRRIEKWAGLICVILIMAAYIGLESPANAIKREYVKMRGGIVQVNSPDSSAATKARADIQRLINAYGAGEQEGDDKMERLAYLGDAIHIADSVFGRDSHECLNIMITRMLPEIRGNIKLLSVFYQAVTHSISPYSDDAYELMYQSARYMEEAALDTMAMKLYYGASRTAPNKVLSLKAEIMSIVSGQRANGGDLMNKLERLVPKLRQLSHEEECEVLFKISYELAQYYDKLGEPTQALVEIEKCESFIEYAPAEEKILMMQLKYRLLLDLDHQGAIECLDRALDYAQNEFDPDKNQLEWIAAIALQRGDYAMNEELDELKAVGYYYYCANLLGNPLKYSTRLERSIGRRLAECTFNFGFEDLAIEMYNDILAGAQKYGLDEADLPIALDLAEKYLASDCPEEAGEILLFFCDGLEKIEFVSARYLLLKAEYFLAVDQPREAVGILGSLINMDMLDSQRIMLHRTLALAYTQCGDSRMAELSDTINMDTKRVIVSYMRNLTPSARHNWLEFCDEAIESQLKLTGNPRAVYNAAELNLFRKSLLFRTSTALSDIIKSIPENALMIERIGRLGEMRNDAVMRGDRQAAEAAKEEMESLEQRLSASFANRGNLLERIDCRVEEISSAMPKDAMAVDFIEFREGKQHMLGAFVWSARKEPEYVDIVSLRDGYPENIGEIIWNRLALNMVGYDKIYFSADGDLNATPIEFSLISDNAINDVVKLHRVFHLADVSPDVTIGDSVAIVAVADHNSPLYPGADASRGSWVDLPETEVEKNLIMEHMSPRHVIVLYNDEATERHVKKLNGSDISTLHISTHGVFRDRYDLEEAADKPESEDYWIACRMLAAGKQSIAGLILRQGNIWWHTETVDSDEDDILTAEEIELMSFPNLNLVVLSACDSGLGEIDSDGVWGLQRAFRIAGTKKLICTLSKVDDYWTSQFMDAFYEKAAQSISVYESFQSAQRWLRLELPDNPEIWSSFILIE